MALPRSLLVDSSFYIRELRLCRDPLAQLWLLSEKVEISTCGIIAAEVGRGMIHRKARDRFNEAFSLMCYLPTDQKLWSKTEEMAWKLDRQGKKLPLTDIIIAACAIQYNASILTHDRHFLEIPEVETAFSLDEINNK